MTSLHVGSSGTGGSTLTIGELVAPTYLGVVACVMPVAAELTGLAVTVGTAPLFGARRALRVLGSVHALELWLCWGLPDRVGTAAVNSIILTTTRSDGAVTGQYASFSAFETAAVQTSAMTSTASAGASGTSTTVDSALVTPAADGDLVVAAGAWNTTAAATAAADTPGGNDGLAAIVTGATSAPRLHVASRLSARPVAHRRTWTIGSAAWVGGAIAVTPVAPTPLATTRLYKGRGSRTADTLAGA